MRVRWALAPALAALGAACAGSPEVVSRTEDAVVLRWDEGRTSPARVVDRAIDLCSGYGMNVLRAFAEDVEGRTHTTRYACRPARRR